MTGLWNLIRRNVKIFFKDKAMFFTSLITPLILLVLYATFLGKVYHDSFISSFPPGFSVSEKIVTASVGGQLLSSLLAVSCVTVAFCSNLLMIQDKVLGSRKDLTVTPVRKSVLSLGYFVASASVTLIVSYTAMLIGFIYLLTMGWYLSVGDVLLLTLDVFLLTLFGTALSSLVNCNLSTNGQASAVGTIISSGYGFISGAYMPISTFSEGLQKVISFLPGTYGTSLIRNHCMRGTFREMEKAGIPAEIVDAIRDSIDCNLYFFGHRISIGGMYVILVGSVAILIGLYVLWSTVRKKKL